MTKEVSFFDDFKNVIGQVTGLTKNEDNPFFKSKFAGLNQVLDMIKPVLALNNFILYQIPVYREGKNILKTVVRHISGEVLESEIELVAKDSTDPQKLGSAITYMRRYSLVAMFNLQAEDDDGNSASGNDKPSLSSDKQREMIVRLANEKGSSLTQITEYYKVTKLPELTSSQASDCIEMLKKKEKKDE